MSQASISIANGSGAAVRAAVNSALQAITTKQSGGTAPSTTYPFMEWADTANDLLKQRNAANSAWIIKGTLSAEYGGIPASGISYDPGNPPLLDATTVQEAIDELASSGSAPKGHIYGLTLSNNGSDANNDIDIATGEAVDNSTSVLMQLSSSLTKRLDASWAVGTNQGGLDAGSKAASTTYHVWLIRRPDTGVVDALFSTSATSPTMPTNYTQKRRIGAVRTDGSGNILAFSQVGDQFLWRNVNTDVNVTNFGTTATNFTLTVPTGVKVIALINTTFSKDSSAVAGYLYSPDSNDETATTSGRANVGSQASGNSSAQTGQLQIRTNTSAQIRGVATAANCNLAIGTVGYIDRRGRDD